MAEIRSIFNYDSYKIVILESPYHSIQSKTTQELLGKIIALKIKGYLTAYPLGILPIDATDYVANHLLLCKEVNGTLEPIMGMRSITAQQCKFHNLKFPVENLYPDIPLLEHRQPIMDLLKTLEDTGEQIAFNSSWTIDPEVGNDKNLRQFCKDITVFLLIQYYLEYQIPHVFAVATLRFKVERIKTFVGYDYIRKNGIPIPSIHVKSFYNEPGALMYLHKMNEDALHWSKNFMSFWENRITISKKPELSQQQAA